ncbi:MAG: hypothetical protein PHW60_03675 [Kiritimatiellae bacterium]|nr:hypothetical protein [Kiritimatiellia bacterium]
MNLTNRILFRQATVYKNMPPIGADLSPVRLGFDDEYSAINHANHQVIYIPILELDVMCHDEPVHGQLIQFTAHHPLRLRPPRIPADMKPTYRISIHKDHKRSEGNKPFDGLRELPLSGKESPSQE